MSTRMSLFYNNKYGLSHFYKDVADDLYHIEKEQKHIVDISLSLEEIISIAKSVDLNELNRQANLSDEQIVFYTTSEYQKSKLCTGLLGLWVSRVFGNSELPDEERIQNGISYYKNIRDGIRKALKDSEGFKTDRVCYGLENFK